MAETLAEVQARLTAAHAVGGQTRIFFSNVLNHPAGHDQNGQVDAAWPSDIRDRLRRVRWHVLDIADTSGASSPSRASERSGLIDVLDLGEAGETAWEVGTGDKTADLIAELEAWIVDYANRPWKAVISLDSVDTKLRIATITAATPDGGDPTVGTVAKYVIRRVGGVFSSIRLTNAPHTSRPI